MSALWVEARYDESAHTELPDVAEVFARIDQLFHTLAKPDSFAAIFVEPIQGEGGYIVPPDDFLPRLFQRYRVLYAEFSGSELAKLV